MTDKIYGYHLDPCNSATHRHNKKAFSHLHHPLINKKWPPKTERLTPHIEY